MSKGNQTEFVKPAVNYIKLINWIWSEVPHLDGFKATYIALYLAIIDSINTNNWNPVSLPYDYIINKVKIDKTVYLRGRQWLIDNNLLCVQLGKNNYQMARFGLGIAVEKSTGNTTSITTSKLSSIIPAQPPALHHIYKQETNKQETLNISFDEFWNLYDKKVGRNNSIKEWNRLTDDERKKAIDHIPSYIKSQPEKKYRKHPERYLKNKCFNDEVLLRSIPINNDVLNSKILAPYETTGSF